MNKLALLGLLAVLVGGCAGEVSDEDDALEVSDESTSQALSSPDPSTGTGGDGDATDDKSDCNERDHEKHRHHRHHKFKVLDRIDGTKDHAITIASLPADLPDRLIARLHELDVDGDGVVTKHEAKVWLKKDHKPKH